MVETISNCIYIRSLKYPTNCWILSSCPTIIGVIAIIVWYNDSYDPIYSIYQLSSYTVGCPPILVALHMLSTAESHARLRRPTSERILKNWSGLPQNNWEIELIEPVHLVYTLGSGIIGIRILTLGHSMGISVYCVYIYNYIYIYINDHKRCTFKHWESAI